MTSLPPKASAQAADIFSRARSQLPQIYEGAKAFRNEPLIELHLQLPADSANYNQGQIAFYPETNNFIDQSIDPVLSTASDTPNHFILTLKEDTASETKTQQIKGVLVINGSDPAQIPLAFDISAPINDKTEGELIGMADLPKITKFLGATMNSSIAAFSSPNTEFEGGIGTALLLAFIGGMILNLMPCVLPVISFKILSFVKLAGSKPFADI